MSHPTRPFFGSHSDTSAINVKHMVTDLFTQMREPSPGAASPLGSTGSLGASVTRNIGFCNQNSTEQPPWASPAVSLPGNCNSNLTTEPQSALVRSNSNASVLTSLSADLSPSDSHFFEVLYIGKVRISQRKVPESLIDDALTKFAQHQAEKALRRRHSLLSSTGTSLYSSNSRENLTDDKKTEASDSNKKINQINLNPSTTPLEPNKNTWKSAETLSEKPESKDLDDEFDMFTKERVTVRPTEKEKKVQRPTNIPLEPSVLILNVPKVNLGTVDEDEEKNDSKIHNNDIKSIISETATNITQFCSDASKSASIENMKPNNPFSKDSFLTSDEKIDGHIHLFITEDHERTIKTESKSNNLKLDQIDSQIKSTTQSQHTKENLTGTITDNKITELDKANTFKESIVKFKDSPDSPKKINFEEITRKPKNNEVERKGMPENKPFLRDRSASIGTISHKTPIAQLIGEQNRTMLFQIGRSELRLISPDRKQILLHRAFKDVASCVLGRVNKEHFGFVCRETNDSYACYVFQCESDSIATEVVNAIRQAFVAHAELLKKTRDKSPNMTCEHCPMLWYHRLCHDVEGMNDKKTHAFILRRIEHLPEDEQDLIITKYQGGTNHMYETTEHNSFLMMLLRAHCEAKQTRHVHDTAENRSEFLNQYLGGSTIFMKAKRSISSGFDNLLKRRASRDELGQTVKKETSPLPTPVSDTPSEPELLQPSEVRSKSLSPAVISQDNGSPSPKHAMTPTQEEEEEEIDEEEGLEDYKEEGAVPVNSPMMDIFLQVSDNRPAATEGGSEPDYTWRHAIYQKVLQPQEEEGELSTNLLRKTSAPKGKRSKEELRQLWKMAIEQTVLLVRMEKENARLKEREESSAVRRIKLEYIELGVCDPGVVLMWDSLLSKDPSQPMAKVDRHMLTQAVMQGVPRMSRGAVWYFLAEQASLRAPPPDTRAHPHYSTPYRALLGGLTKHQHAILIDLGRTFPKHSYFASALGPGQLALYNILKAYSLLDPDVGYCQGLSFVAGVLLLHMEEAEAFILLRHLMFRRGLRKQYLPDMSALQVQLYQLSRLVRDHEPELHSKLEELDISPALYAAPWMLTAFTSQFPLGFVVRVFDLLFLESMDVIFSMALAILSAHKDGLMLCESCEEAAEYLKHKIPDMSSHTYRKIMKKVHALDISRQLSDYAVEYAVLREEMPRVASLTEENRTLTAERSRMTEELDSAMDSLTNFQKNQVRLETSNKSMEQQLALLSRYINTHHKQDLPPEIKKIVQNHSKRLSFSSKLFSTKYSADDEEKRIPKTGISTPNLFAKITDNKEIIRESPERERKVFIMKKSQSVHSGLIANLKPLKEETNELTETLKELGRNTEKESPKARRNESFNTQTKNELTESLKELGKKNSGFFANTHKQIQQERLFEKQLKHDFDENLKKLDEKLSPKSYMDDLTIFQSRKCMSLNLNSKNESKIDSGFVTPLTPDKKTDSSSTISHPLSDVDVEIKFDGQSTKLKQIRPLKPCVDNKM